MTVTSICPLTQRLVQSATFPEDYLLEEGPDSGVHTVVSFGQGSVGAVQSVDDHGGHHLMLYTSVPGVVGRVDPSPGFGADGAEWPAFVKTHHIVALSFANVESVDVVIGNLQNLRADMVAARTTPETT